MLKDSQQPRDRRILQEAATHEAEHIVLSGEIFKGREKVQGLTIDGPNSKDLDDAIWLRQENGSLIADISIADVSALIRPGSALHTEALQRTETRYYARGNDPMLPYVLSEDKLSLLEGEKRPTITISVPLSPDFTAGPPRISQTYVESEMRLSYADAASAIKDPRDLHHEMLKATGVIALSLLKQRIESGAMALFDIRRGIIITEDGAVETLRPEERNIANLIVQEFMILANQSVAAYCAERGVPILFRNHRAKDIAPKRESILEDINQILLDPNEGRISTLRKRLSLILERANYGRVLEGHYALNLAAYARMTSPIRRAVDLVNWGQVSASLNGAPLPYTPEELDGIADHLNAVEMEIKDQKTRRFISEHGQPKREIGGNTKDLAIGNLTQILRVAVREDSFPQDLETSLLERIATGQIDANLAYNILLEAGAENEAWVRLKEATVVWLQKNPNAAISVLNQAHSILGWSVLKLETHEVDAGFSSKAKVTVDEQDHVSQPQIAPNKRMAEQVAAVDLLMGIITKDQERQILPAPQGMQPLEPRTTKQEPNFKGNLIELRNTHHWRQEQYTTEQGGPPHRRTFQTQVKIQIGEREYTSDLCTGPTIKDSEQKAAANLLDKLRAAGFQGETRQDQAAVIWEMQPHTKQTSEVNFKGILQEASQQRGGEIPDYIVIDQVGPDHQPTFTVVASVEVNGKRIESAPKVGSSRRLAEQLAAQNLLDKLGITQVGSAQEKKIPDTVVRDNNFVSALQELQAKSHKATPSYSFRDLGKGPDGAAQCACTIRGADGKNYVYNAYGLTRKEAKQKAAELAFQEQSVLAKIF